ncbi:SdpI family protein [Streptomyces sp. NPDC091272]|uniref:SdpI family protein n=1 Tax=Streptomyces sp. NPDC091272 TaxID=3365981 RepID=UPI0037FBF2DA
MPDTVPPGAALVIAVLLGLTGLGLVVVGRIGATGLLRRNALVGIRTARSTASDEAWRSVHRTAAPWLYAAGAVPLAAAVAMPFIGHPAVLVGVALGSLALLLVLLALGVRRATRALPPPGLPGLPDATGGTT